MNNIERIQNWYGSQCDGDWEHQSGVEIETLDNPGWKVDVDLRNTALAEVSFAPLKYGLGQDNRHEGANWLVCKVEGELF